MIIRIIHSDVIVNYKKLLDQKPIISIILPTYNHGKFIEKSIKSVINNCSKAFELIIINDGSRDNTEEILKRYCRDSRLRIINQQNIGLAESLNKGFNLARGQYLTWTSADNLYKNLALDKLSNFLDRNADIDMVYADVELIDDSSKLYHNSSYRIANQNKKKSYILNLPYNTKTLACFADNFINACFMYRSWIPQALGGYRSDLLGFEDYEYWLRILATGKIAHLDSNQALYQYRVHKESLTGKLNAKVLSLKQREIVSFYYKLLNDSENKNFIEAGLSHNTNREINNFLNSLPLKYYDLTSLKNNHKLNSALKISGDTAIDCPEILSRIHNADYKAFILSKNTKLAVSLFLPEFIETGDINLISAFIKKNKAITFVCVCNSDIQNRNALCLKDLLIKQKNLVIIDLTKSPEMQDNLLPEERYLPFVYALANSSLFICPLPKTDFELCARAMLTLTAKAKANCLLISNALTEKPTFCEILNWENLAKAKIPLKIKAESQSCYDSWVKNVSPETYSRKINNLANFYNFSLP